MELSFLRRLFRHMEWADSVIWRSILDEQSLADDDFILDGIVHLHLVQHAYLSLWRNHDIIDSSREDFRAPADIRDWARAYYPEVFAFFDEIGEGELDELKLTPWTDLIEKGIGRPPAPASLRDMIVQVASHSVHHRAQINRRIRELGSTPHMLDYIGWVWRDCPPAEW